MFTLVLLGYICGTAITFVDASNNCNTLMDEYRLSGDVVPEKYDLEVVIDLDNAPYNFYGNVSIQIICVTATKFITLHCSDLVILEDLVTIGEINEAEPDNSLIKEQVYLPGSHFYRIQLGKSLEVNKKYNLYISFQGTLSTGLVGLYRSSYFDNASNKTYWMAATHFEPTFARKAFPCFDEPAMKAKFNIKIGHNENLKALSNMPVKKITSMKNEFGWVWTEFEETLPMSTYLVAYVVGNIDFKEADPKSNNVTFRVWSRPDVLNQIDFAKEFGPEVLEFYEGYFNIKYPISKLDLIAVPDFSIGAMENWGLITFRETALLYNEKGSTTKDKHDISSVIAHEIAHQWFGNLVTMKWWTDLWLKEGFATFLGNLGVQQLHPDWHFLGEAVIRNVESVYYLDSLESSHPVSVEICNPSEIAQIFDIISYQKGSMIIRMMNSFLGKSFQHGLSDYLNEHKLGNAAQDDLWTALTNRAHRDGTLKEDMSVKDVMDTWTLQTGYPLVTIERDYKTGKIKVSQNRYYRTSPKQKEGSAEEEEQLWKIPLTYTTKSELNFTDKSTKFWLTKNSDQLDVTVKADEWILFNIEVAGLYRVKYDKKNLRLIIDTLKSDNYSTIPPVSRANLLLDIFDLGWKGELDYDLVFNMVEYLTKEQEYLPLSVGLQQLGAIGRMLVRTPAYGHFQGFIRKLITPIYERYDNILDPGNETRLHALVTDWACAFDIEKCRIQALDLFKQWQTTLQPDENNPIPTDIRPAVYSSAVRHGDSEVWNFLWERYQKSNYPAEKIIILKALGSSRDVWVINRYLDWSIQENSGIRRQDAAIVFAAIAGQPIGSYIAVDFLQRRIADIHKYHSQKSEVISRYLNSSSKYFIYSYEINQWKEFITKHGDQLKGASLAAKQSVDVVHAQGEWNSLHYTKVAHLLKLK